MKKNLLIVIVLIIFILTSCDSKENEVESGDINQYTLDVYLNTENFSLEVSGNIEYVNEIDDLEELYIMLYPNATNLSNREHNVLMEYLKIDGKDVDYEYANNDDTAMYIKLDRLYNNEEVINIEFSYEFNYWDIDRIYAEEEYFLTMFFYPFVAVHDDYGWNIDEYTFMGETYYNTLGDYEVTINVPSDYLVATSGKEISSENSNGRLINIYSIDNARDFSFSASTLYVLYEREINDRMFSIYARGGLTLTEQNNSFKWLNDSFELYSELFGEYNQDHFTLEYGYFYGMESTGIVYCSEILNEGTVVHEVIHQWFYSMVGNDQFDYSFLDEAITTYSSALYYRDKFGIEGYNGLLDYRDSLKPSKSEDYEKSLDNSLLSTVSEMGDKYGLMIYYHGPTMIRYYIDEFLEGDIDQFVDVLRVYFEEYNGSVATLTDFLDILEEETGVSNTTEWFMMQLQNVQDLDNRP